jgi:hypothetical protein
MGTPRLTLTIVRAGPENTWGSPAVLHDSLQHTHTSVWPRERLFFFSFREKTSSWLASHLITRRTVGIYSYTLLALDWKQTNQRFVVQRWKKTTFEGEKRNRGAIHVGGAKFWRQAVRQSGKYRLADTNNNVTRFISPLCCTWLAAEKRRDASAT